MLDNTKNFFLVLKEDVKKILRVFEILSLVVTLTYAVVGIILEVGNFWINVSVLVIASTYTILNLIFSSKLLSRAYKATKLSISLISLIISVYGIYVSATNTNGIMIIIATLMIIFWILQFGILLLSFIIEKYGKTLEASLLCDLKPALRAWNIKEAFAGDNITKVELDSNQEHDLAKIKEKALAIKNNKELLNNKKKIKETINNSNLEKLQSKLDLNAIIDKDLKLALIQKKNTLKAIMLMNKDNMKANSLTYSPLNLESKESKLRRTIDRIIGDSIANLKLDVNFYKALLRNASVSYEAYLEHSYNLSDLFALMQKLIYVYDFPEIKPNIDLDSNTRLALKYALAIIVGEDKYHDLYLLAKKNANPINSTMRMFNNISGGIKSVQKQIFNDEKDD